MISFVSSKGKKLCTCAAIAGIKLVQRNYGKVKVKKHNAKEFALNHFDQFYGGVFENWPSIRLGLLCPHSYCAVVNAFADQDQVSNVLMNVGAFDIRDHYTQKLLEYQTLKSTEQKSALNNLTKSEFINTHSGNESVESVVFQKEHTDHPIQTEKYLFEQSASLGSSDSSEDAYVQPTRFKYRDVEHVEEEFSQFYSPTDTDFKVKVVNETLCPYPDHWKIFFFPRGKFKEFPPPKNDPSGILNYYLMDGASILPVLALNVQDGETVGDLCAAPGGKSLAILFSLRFGKLFCNDASFSRLSKLKTVLKLYLPSISDWNKRIFVSQIDVSSWHQFDTFDKILLDVPCTNDRLSLSKESNNIFKQSRFNERMKLPLLQTEMLCCALQALKPNGSLVYSTCSLSPLQNDGVVHMALSKVHGESQMEFVVCDLKEAFYPVTDLYSFSYSCKYGQLVIPYLPLNYGPMYICKINRIK